MPSLDELRSEIDRIDDQLHDLLIRRVEIGRAVAAAKGDHTGPFFLPNREAQVIRRLVARNREPLQADTLVRFWYEIMKSNLHLQVTISASVYDPSDDAVTLDLARTFCGALTPVKRAASAREVFDAVAGGDAEIGVIPAAVSGDRWWRLWCESESTEPVKPRIVARLPFLMDSKTSADAPLSFVLGDFDPLASAEDRSIFAVKGDYDHPHHQLDSHDGWQLIEVEGHTGGNLPHAQEGLHWRYLGAYPVPVSY